MQDKLKRFPVSGPPVPVPQGARRLAGRPVVPRVQHFLGAQPLGRPGGLGGREEQA